jgi:hypothetical protein
MITDKVQTRHQQSNSESTMTTASAVVLDDSHRSNRHYNTSISTSSTGGNTYKKERFEMEQRKFSFKSYDSQQEQEKMMTDLQPMAETKTTVLSGSLHTLAVGLVPQSLLPDSEGITPATIVATATTEATALAEAQDIIDQSAVGLVPQSSFDSKGTTTASQHHAWLTPPHRKTLRQQPFQSCTIAVAATATKGTTLNTTTSTSTTNPSSFSVTAANDISTNPLTWNSNNAVCLVPQSHGSKGTQEIQNQAGSPIRKDSVTVAAAAVRRWLKDMREARVVVHLAQQRSGPRRVNNRTLQANQQWNEHYGNDNRQHDNDPVQESTTTTETEANNISDGNSTADIMASQCIITQAMYERYCDRNIEKDKEHRRKQRSRKRQKEKKKEARTNLVKIQAVVRGYLIRKMILFEGKLPMKHEITKTNRTVGRPSLETLAYMLPGQRREVLNNLFRQQIYQTKTKSFGDGPVTQTTDAQRKRNKRKKHARLEKRRRDGSGNLRILRPTEQAALAKIQRIARAFVARLRTRVRFRLLDLLQDKAADSGVQWRQLQQDRQRACSSNFTTTKWHSWKVDFMWRERIYDEAGNYGCQIVYSKWSVNGKVYLKETRHGSRLQIAQLESHQKSKKARAAHQELLLSVQEELNKQRRKRVPKDILNQKNRKITKSSKASDHSSRPITESLPETPRNPPAIAQPVEHPLQQPVTIQVTRPPQVQNKYRHIKDKPIGRTKIKEEKETPEGEPLHHPKVTPAISWIQDTRGVWALHTSHPSYLLPLPWQHHAWTAPAHRKTLRQQPF